MGEMAEYLLNGDDCQYCGEHLGSGDGYPRSCAGCDDEESEEEENCMTVSDEHTPKDSIDSAIIWLEIAKEELLVRRSRKKAKSIDGFIKQLNIFCRSI